MPLLEVENLSVEYGQVLALSNVSLCLEPGTIYAVLGPNGAGKTSLLRAVSGVIRPAQGQVRYLGQDVTSLTSHERVRRGLVYQPETRELFPGLSVLMNIKLGGSSRPSLLSDERLREILGYFPDLRGKLMRRPNTMSGGEQQMVCMARSLATQPTVLTIDEPSLGLSPKLVTDLFGVLSKACKSMGITMLLAEQNARMAMKVADYALFLRAGNVALQGPVADLRDLDLSSYYLGASG